MEAIQWENGIIAVPLTANLPLTLDQAGLEGWCAWAILGGDAESIKIAVRRPKQKIILATQLPNGPVSN